VRQVERYLWVGGQIPEELLEFWMAKEFGIPPSVLEREEATVPYLMLAIQDAIERVGELRRQLDWPGNSKLSA
jgi:hypothetical protein